MENNYQRDMIIANPNCSTIQLLMVLSPLHKKYKIKRVVLSPIKQLVAQEKSCRSTSKRTRWVISRQSISSSNLSKHFASM